MDKEEVYTLASVIIAFSTFTGVGSASAFYLTEIKTFTVSQILLTEVIYILMSVILLVGIKRGLR